MASDTICPGANVKEKKDLLRNDMERCKSASEASSASQSNDSEAKTEPSDLGEHNKRDAATRNLIGGPASWYSIQFLNHNFDFILL